ncbi:hypothetical protein [Spirillospora sp. NPDC047279]|uniref:hypothetical protein n=1 Tax=Spirillospora sp. NPDC047279 TaxID=3155478 RepID=UPI00340FAE39
MALGVGVALAMGLAVVTSPAARADVPAAPSAAGQFYKARVRVASGLEVAAGATVSVQVAGKGSIPASGVASVETNFAVLGDGGSGQLAVFPSDAAKPDTTATRFHASLWTHNLLFSKVGADGHIKIANGGAVKAFVYADVQGYTLNAAGASAGSTYRPVQPSRIQQITVPSNGEAKVAPLGKGGIPTTGVTDVALTVGVKTSTAGTLRVYTSGWSQPTDTSLNYGSGLYLQNNVIGKLGADGQLTFFNSGPSAITFDVDAVGYYAAPTAAVSSSTIRPVVPARLLAGLLMPAGGSYVLEPLGKGGVPASGVTGIAINATTVGVGTGAVRVYPSGTTEPGTHTVSYFAGSAYSGAQPVKLGTDGKVIIKNTAAAEVRVWVDVFAYFQNPATGCSAGAASATTPAPVSSRPLQSNTRTTVVQQSPLQGASLGPIHYAYTDGAGYLRHGFQTDPGNFGNIQYTSVPGAEAYTGQPALAEQGDGRLQVMAHNTTSSVWSAVQASKNLPGWGAWVGNSGSLASHASLARHDDTLVAFAVDGAGTLWAMPQFGANEGYREWINLGMTGLSSATTPVAVPVREGLRVFALDATGVWRTALYSRGVLSGCESLSGPGFSGQPSVVVWPGSRTQIFVRGTDGKILTKKQDETGAFPANWTTTGDFTAIGDPAALISPITSTVEVVARGADQLVYSTGESPQGSGQWRTWVPKSSENDYLAATDPTVFSYVGTNGPRWAFLYRSDTDVTRIYVTEGSGTLAQRSADAGGQGPEFTGHTLPTAPPVKGR